MGVAAAPGWRGERLAWFGLGYDPASICDCFWHGFLYFLPIYAVTMVAGGFWESAVRRGPQSRGERRLSS